MSPEISIRASDAGQRYEALLRISEALSACTEPEDLTRILSEQLRDFLDFFQFYILVYKENSTEVEWAVVGSEKSLISAYADVPLQERPSWRAYATQEPFHIADWDADERVPARLKQGIAAQGLEIGPLVFVPLTTPHRRLGALGMSGPPGAAYSSEDIGFLRLIGRVVAFAIDDNFNLRQAEAAQRELQRQNERLQSSERELQEVIETIPVMAWSAAPDGTAEFFNRRWLDYAGLSSDQVQGWGWTSAVHPDDLNGLTDYWRGVLASGQSGEIEARLRRFDGAYRWFLFRATPSLDNGRVVKWYGTNTDIEARKTAEQAIITQNSRLQLLLKLTKEITSNLDFRELLRAISASIREVMDCDAVHISFPDPASGKFRLYALDFPEGKGFVKEEMLIESIGACKRALETLQPAIRNTANPQEFPPDLYKLMVAEGLKSQCVIPLVSRGRVVGALSINRSTDDAFLPDEIDFLENSLTPCAFTPDRVAVLELLASQAAISLENAGLYSDLQRSEAFLAQGERICQTGIFGWNVSSGEIYWSDGTYNIFEFDRTAKPTVEMAFQRVHPDDRDFVRQTHERAINEKTDFNIEHRLLMPDGAVKHVHAIGHALQSSSGELEFVGAGTDVTAAKVAEEKIRQSESELRQILDVAPQHVYVLGPDPDTTRLYVNQAALDYLGLTADEWRTCDHRELFHPDDRERAERGSKQNRRRPPARSRRAFTGKGREISLVSPTLEPAAGSTRRPHPLVCGGNRYRGSKGGGAKAP